METGPTGPNRTFFGTPRIARPRGYWKTDPLWKLRVLAVDLAAWRRLPRPVRKFFGHIYRLLWLASPAAAGMRGKRATELLADLIHWAEQPVIFGPTVFALAVMNFLQWFTSLRITHLDGLAVLVGIWLVFFLLWWAGSTFLRFFNEETLPPDPSRRPLTPMPATADVEAIQTHPLTAVNADGTAKE